ncbi:DNA glycosylase [Hyaloscypha finlandica]|nr:DNA glycosylase [Hyaloscypha finlandica]
MPRVTRATAEREAAFLAQSLGAESLSSPPVTPLAGNECDSGAILPSPTPSVPAKRKRGTRKTVPEPITGGWDVLPHGLGKKGDLADGSNIDQVISDDAQPARAGKRPRQGDIARDADSSMLEVNGDGVKDIKHEAFQEEKPKKKRTPRMKKVFDTSKDVLDKVDELIDASGNVSKERKKKHPYGLTPGYSPFPGHAMPTPDACEEVNRLLSELHGTVEQPKVVPPPSMDIAGCGEVPDLLDAILRTKLSASTTANNANLSLKGLIDKFGLRASGVGKESVNWDAVHEADLSAVIESIKSGGLAKTKGTDIKKILDMVYERNRSRRDELLKEKETGESADVLGANHETRRQKDVELARFDETLLTMDHVFEMTTDEAMEEITKLPGIGVKTASCAILFCMKRPSFAVDTHVWRHCKWLGWVPEKATRDQTFSHCEVRVPDHLKYSLHQLFLRHGKTCGRCRANTSAGTKEWDEANCPIEHLVSRKEARKQPGGSPIKKTKPVVGKKGAKSKKGKKTDYDETEESEAEVEGDVPSEESEAGDDTAS